MRDSVRFVRACGVVSALVFAAAPSSVSAHGDALVTRDGLWGHWNLNPLMLLSLFVVGWLYSRGLGALWRRAGIGRGVRPWQAALFAGGLMALVIALVSPLDELGGTLFAAHMGQHMLLTLVAAPLLVLGAPTAPLLWSLPRSWRLALPGLTRRPIVHVATRGLTRPFVAVALHSAVIWLWHAPVLYQAALRSDLVHAFEHVSFFGTALLFWWVIARAGVRRGRGYGSAVLGIFALALQGTALGALIAFSPTAWYPIYADGAAAWGLSALQDQQIAGMIMWIPAGMIYLGAVVLLVGNWLTGMDRRSARIVPSSTPPVNREAQVAP